jgi:hypothetical protein
VATLAALSDRLRAEIGDIGRSFIETFEGDGSTKRFQLTYAPVKASSLVIKVGNTNVSSTAMVEEVVGMVELATAPAPGSTITISGTAHKYFTDSEIEYYVNTAFYEHARSTTDSNGALATITSLPPIDEYPLVILASTMALYTLATDSAFDIDIISPDGVSIPRSERFRQVSEIIQNRKEQYRELCNMLGIGMYKIEVFTLRRISRRTNRYVPVYRPKEIDDGSLPQRVFLPIPTYGDITPESPVPTRDLSLYAGDEFNLRLKFNKDMSTLTPLSQIRLFPKYPANQVGPLIVATFEITKEASIPGGTLDTLLLHLDPEVTATLPRTAYWDIQLTDSLGGVKTYLTGKVFTRSEVTTTYGNFSV